MSRTFKDQKGFVKTKNEKRGRLNKKYLAFRQNGSSSDFEYTQTLVEDYVLDGEGEHCPHCGMPTGFERGFLVCSDCGWVDAGPEAIFLEVA